MATSTPQTKKIGPSKIIQKAPRVGPSVASSAPQKRKVGPFELKLRSVRHAYLQALRDAAADLPVRKIWAARHPSPTSVGQTFGKVRFTVPLRCGLSSDIVQIVVDADGKSAQQAVLLAQDLKAAISQQVCGNALVFDLLYDSVNEPPTEGGDRQAASCDVVKLADMEELLVHCSQHITADTDDFPNSVMPNLVLLWHGTPRFFETHDNGGRPFKVGVTRNYVSIHANYNPENNQDGRYLEGTAPLVAELESCAKAFVGVSSGSCWCDHGVDWEDRFGNSVLVCLEGGKSEVNVGLNHTNFAMTFRTGLIEPRDKFFFHRLFEETSEVRALCSKLPSAEQNRGLFIGPEQTLIFIGDRIYAFTVPDNDEVLEYYSMIGTSDVPYPVAIGRKYVYFMLDHVFVPRAAINEETWLHDPEQVEEGADGPRWEDAYLWFYEAKDVERKPFPNYRLLAHRQC